MTRKNVLTTVCSCCVVAAFAFVLFGLADLGYGQMIRPLDNPRRSAVVKVFETAGDAVVNISTTKVQPVRGTFWGDSIFDDIFNFNFPDGAGGGAGGFRRNRNITSLGSGFIIHPDGFIMTNEHVVQRATQITVSLADGSSYPASVVATDHARDLALLKISAADGVELPALPLGRSDDLMIGETVVAIGNPKGYRNSVTSGLVSATGRKLEFGNNVEYSGLIQTDAAINPGNSGGPLLNVNAEVIGINTAIRADAQGIGFAIAIDDVVRDLPRLLDLRGINRLDIGMELDVTGDSTGRLELVVKNVRDYGPAHKAALEEGMKIRSINGESMTSPADFFIRMLAIKAGQKVSLDVDGRSHELEIVQVPEPDGEALARRLLGVTFKPVTPELARKYRLPLSEGMFVTGVWDDSPAASIGLQARDVVFQLSRSYVTSLEQVGRILEGVRPGNTIRIGVARGNYRVQTTITAGDMPEE